MRDWLSENSAAVTAAVAAIVVTLLSAAVAEGGRGRRKVKRLKEELELLDHLRKDGTFGRLEGSLHESIEIRLNAYVRERAARRAFGAGLFISLVPGLVFIAVAGLFDRDLVTVKNYFMFVVPATVVLVALTVSLPPVRRYIF